MINDYVDLVLKFANFFANFPVILPVIVLGYIWVDRKVFSDAISLLLLGMIYNFALKITFKVPLFPHLGSGFAFPSGHMAAAIILYGWMAFKFQNIILRVFLIGLLAAIGFGLVHFKYHDYFDVLGSAFFAPLLMITYYFASLKFAKQLPFYLVIIGSILIIYAAFAYKVSDHLWISYYSLIGFVVSERLFPNDNIKQTILEKVVSSILFLSIIALTKLLFSMSVISQMPPIMFNIQWFIIAFSLPASTNLFYTWAGNK